MNDLFKNIKKLKIGKKNMILLGLAGFIMLVLLVGEAFGSDSSETASKEDTINFSLQYTEKTEKELEALLEKISGADPYLATQLCHWYDNWCTSGMSIPVLSY